MDYLGRNIHEVEVGGGLWGPDSQQEADIVTSQLLPLVPNTEE